MFKPLIAGITALSLTLATAAPAQANGLDREDVGKLLFGLAAIALVNRAVQDNRRQAAPPVEAPVETRHGNNSANSWADLDHPSNRRAERARVLPRECLRGIETRFGTQRMFVNRCLTRNYRHVDSLPQRCAVRVFTANGPRSGYDPLCLREQGYRTNRRH